MKITSIKQQKNGLLINGTTSVPDGYSGWMSEHINEWLLSNEVEPEFNEAELLTEAKESKRNEIRQAFNTVSESPVLVGTTSYHGGFDSAMKLDAAKRMVEALEGIEVTFYDIDNLPHTLSLVEAQEVITAIGADYQSKFAIKQDKMVQVESALSIEEVENVSA